MILTVTALFSPRSWFLTQVLLTEIGRGIALVGYYQFARLTLSCIIPFTNVKYTNTWPGVISNNALNRM